MKIDKLTASFGQLENRTLRLHDGLNVIYAPNESGKSTWCAFILAMLYGIDSSERAKTGYLPDKQRYAPWSGAPMEGTMELTSGNRSLTLTRTTKSKSAPMKDFTAVYTGTNTPVDALNGSNVGETLTGVPKNVFRRSAFIGQGAIAVNGNPDLERRISAIVTTGEEQSSYSEIDERLRNWEHRRRFNRKGLLPELEAKMAETERRLEDMSGAAEELEQLNGRMEELRIRCEDLEQQVTESRMQQRKEALQQLTEGRTSLKEASSAHDSALAELSLRRSGVRDHILGSLSLQDAEVQVKKDLDNAAQLEKQAARRLSPVPAILLLLLSLASAVLRNRFAAVPLLIAAAVFATVAVVLLLRSLTVSRAAVAAGEALRKLLKQYKVSSAGEIPDLLEEYRSLCAAADRASARERSLRTVYEETREKQEALEKSAIEELDFASGDSKAAQLGRELNSSRAEITRVSDRIARLNGRFAAMGDPLVLNSDLGCMREKQDIIQKEYDAIDLAADVLRDADEELQSRFAPNLGAVAGKYLSALTGGRYTQVLLNRDFSAMAKTAGDTVAHESAYLSAGTMDLMYLAVRLAVCELALPDGEPCPLIIDDALVNLDDTRLKRAMDLLWDISRKRQVILFTCRNPAGNDTQ